MSIKEVMTIKTVQLFGVLALLSIVLFMGSAAALSYPYDAEITVTYVGGDAGFNNEFGIAYPSHQTLGMGHLTTPGSQFNGGTLSRNTDLILYITTPEAAGYTYYSEGDNIDEAQHAKITALANGDYLVEFEDIYGGGDQDFNDIIVQVHAEKTVIPVPEFPTPAVVVGSLIGIIGIIIVIKSNKSE